MFLQYHIFWTNLETKWLPHTNTTNHLHQPHDSRAQESLPASNKELRVWELPTQILVPIDKNWMVQVKRNGNPFTYEEIEQIGHHLYVSRNCLLPYQRTVLASVDCGHGLQTSSVKKSFSVSHREWSFLTCSWEIGLI